MSYKLKDLGYRTFTTLYKSNILSIATYASGIWGYKDYAQNRTLQNRCWIFYLGTHVFTAVAVTNIEMDIIDIRSVQWIEMVRLKNRIQSMDDNRWPKIIMNWDIQTDTDAWFREVKLVLSSVGLIDMEYFDEKTDLGMLEEKLLAKNRLSWHLEAHQKTKLETFVKIHNFDNTKVLVKANLNKRNRSLVTKLKAGAFPIQVEIGHYKGTARDKRFCPVCDKNIVEDEIHFPCLCECFTTEKKVQFVLNLHLTTYFTKAQPSFCVIVPSCLYFEWEDATEKSRNQTPCCPW